MHIAPFRRNCVLVGSVAALLTGGLLLPASVHAYHDRQTPPIDNTAYTLRQGELQLGLLTQHVGILDRVQLSTVLGGYVLGAFTGLFLPNLAAKVHVFDAGDFSFGVGAAFIYARVRPKAPDAGTAGDLFVAPISADVSWRPAQWFIGSFSVTFAWLKSLAGSQDLGATDELNGAATVSNVTLTSKLIFPLTRVTALALTGRTLVFQAPVKLESDTAVDAFTTVDVRGNVEVKNVSWAWQVVPSVFFSWSSFNLRAGIGYGSVFVPELGMVVPKRMLVPEFEACFRF
jgi:hypothetical protein